MTAFFITATGTDIGKTFVAAGLIRHLRDQEHLVEALKPVVSGFDPENTKASDPALLLSALDLPVGMKEIDRISPWRFRAPLSPDMAAAREERNIDFGALLDFCRSAIEGCRGTLFIEGIGGLMVPLDDRHTVLDWIEALKLPVVLVAGSYLGTLSHTLTCLDALKRRELRTAAVVVSESPESPVPLEETVKTIARFSSPNEVIALPRDTIGSEPIAFARLIALLQALPDSR